MLTGVSVVSIVNVGMPRSQALSIVRKLLDKIPDSGGSLCTKGLILNKQFVASKGKHQGQIFIPAIIMGSEFEDSERGESNIGAEAKRRGWKKPPGKLVWDVMDMFSPDDIKRMGLTDLIVMHDPVLDNQTLYTYCRYSLSVNSRRHEYPLVATLGDHPINNAFTRNYGFVYLVRAELVH